MSKPIESNNNIMINGSEETAALYGKYHAGKPSRLVLDTDSSEVDVLSFRNGVESSSNNIMINGSKETAALYGKYLANDKSK